MSTTYFHITKLKEGLSLKQRSNPKYSLRAYARDLEIHPSTLSLILKGKRKLPMKDIQRIMVKLRLTEKERTQFKKSILSNFATLDDIKILESLKHEHMLDESYFKVISEWEHYALLELFDIHRFKCSPVEISKRLGIDVLRAEVVLNHLITCGLIKKAKNGKYFRSHPHVSTSEDIKSLALFQSHIEAMKLGEAKLKSVDIELRDFSSCTVAVNLKKIPEMKSIIREFRQKMISLVKEGKKTDVYQIAIQLYPLTDTNYKEPQ